MDSIRDSDITCLSNILGHRHDQNPSNLGTSCKKTTALFIAQKDRNIRP